jgi:hypothetical protein
MRKKDICEVKKGGVYMSDQNSGLKNERSAISEFGRFRFRSAVKREHGRPGLAGQGTFLC